MYCLENRLDEAKGLIFDCDGTLLDNRDVYAAAWGDGFAAVGARMSLAWHAPRSGLCEQMLLEAFEHEHELTLDRARVVTAMRQSYSQLLSRLREIEPVMDIARRFFGRKPLAVASSGSQAIVLASLAYLGVDGLFDSIVTLDDVGVAKPQPNLYLEAARRLGLPPASCLAFEDSTHGLEAARRAGIPYIDIVDIVGLPRLVGVTGAP